MSIAQPLSLTKRDVSILAFVYSLAGATGELIAQQHFGRSAGAKRACYRRIAHLVKLGLLTRQRLPAFSGVGSGKYFLQLGRRARPVLKEVLGLRSSAELGRVRRQAPFLIQHHLAGAEFRVAFTLACQRSSVFTLLDWIPELELERDPIQVKDPKTGRRAKLIPDSACVLALPNGATQRLYIEIDMGTTTAQRLKYKLGLYLQVQSGCPILFITPDTQRAETIVRWAQEQAKARQVNADIFWVTTQPEIAATSLTSAPIWRVPGLGARALLDMVSSTGVLARCSGTLRS